MASDLTKNVGTQVQNRSRDACKVSKSAAPPGPETRIRPARYPRARARKPPEFKSPESGPPGMRKGSGKRQRSSENQVRRNPKVQIRGRHRIQHFSFDGFKNPGAQNAGEEDPTFPTKTLGKRRGPEFSSAYSAGGGGQGPLPTPSNIRKHSSEGAGAQETQNVICAECRSPLPNGRRSPGIGIACGPGP